MSFCILFGALKLCLDNCGKLHLYKHLLTENASIELGPRCRNYHVKYDDDKYEYDDDATDCVFQLSWII